MTYMGSKRKYCKDIVPIIQKFIKDNEIKVFIDAMCGGANLTDKIKCETVIGNDLSPTLIALHKKAQQDPKGIPETGNREWWDKAYIEYKKVQKAVNSGEDLEKFEISELLMPLWEIGAIEWYGSFSAGGFPRGYAKPSCGRDYYSEMYRNHQKQAYTKEYKAINFIQGDYKEILQKFPELIGRKDILWYFDSPYKDTKPYGINPHFDFDEYYDYLRELSKSYPIFISEQEMPEDFPIIWEKDVNRTVGIDNHFKAVEKLYLIGV